jgi:hypothetical protein
MDVGDFKGQRLKCIWETSGHGFPSRHRLIPADELLHRGGMGLDRLRRCGWIAQRRFDA